MRRDAARDIHARNKRRKINDDIIISDLQCAKKRFCRLRGKHLGRVR